MFFKKKDFLLFATKLIDKILDPLDAKEHYQSFIRKKTKSEKIRNNYLSTKNF